ncbi:glycosyltransferase family 4 protein, partial [Aureobasidium melanogenum]
MKRIAADPRSLSADAPGFFWDNHKYRNNISCNLIVEMTDGSTEVHHDFQARRPHSHVQRLERARKAGKPVDEQPQEIFFGVAATKRPNDKIEVGFCAHDGTYSMDFAVHCIEAKGDAAKTFSDYVVMRVKNYQDEHHYKYLGAGISKTAREISPDLPARLWAELDIPTLEFERSVVESDHVKTPEVDVDEEADAMARKCVGMYGPQKQPLLQVGFLNEVSVDAAGHALLCTLEQYRNTVRKTTWDATMHYAERLKKKGMRMAFLNATPQGGGVALMRHALVRLARLLGIEMKWYVPRPKNEVFRITKTNHNILQGVAEPNERLTHEQAETIKTWIYSTAKRDWLRKKGPLAKIEDGGAHILFVDDPQMPDIVPLAKEIEPGRPVLFRSHIQVRADLVDGEPKSPTAEVFDWLYSRVKEADMFIAHPVSDFVPKVVEPQKVAYLPATTDWLDGLNKELRREDSIYYFRNYNMHCQRANQPPLTFPTRDYIVQIARFDPSKGIDTVIRSYGELRRKYYADTDPSKTPQLCIAGHSSIDDPDASAIFDKTMDLIDSEYSEFADDISVMRLGPIDQELNVLMSNAKICLQLSTREGFEVKVSEALHKGVPVIATRAGGIPLQVEDGKSGFLVDTGDHEKVAEYMHKLFTDQQLYSKMSKYAASHVSDEVSTVGNMLSWLYLADTMAGDEGKKLEVNGRWINDLAREGAGVPYQEGEPRLPRHYKT